MKQAEALLLNQLTSDRLAYRRARLGAILGLVLALAVAVALATSVGSVDIPLTTVWRLLCAALTGSAVDADATFATIVLDIRLPRILLAALVGAALATAGATYQGLFRNPLADPYLIGVAQGAGLGAVVGFLLPFSEPTVGLIPLLAFGGGLASAGVVYSLARVGGMVPLTTLILAGVALGAFLAAITSYLLLASGEQLHGILRWLMGGFTLSRWSQVQTLAPYVALGTAVIYLYSQPLNLMQLDEEQAQQLGVDVERVKLILLVAATLITAAAVAFGGSIGFVGIIVPHAVRLVWGPDHRFLLPLSSLVGATFLILADTVARTLLAPSEIPVGVITAFWGAPFFLYLLRRRQRLLL